jgi:hypothetical protein
MVEEGVDPLPSDVAAHIANGGRGLILMIPKEVDRHE